MVTVTSHRTRKVLFSNVFSTPWCNTKPAFSIFSGLSNAFEKLPFLDGLVWMVGCCDRSYKAASSNFSSIMKTQPEQTDSI